jgi:hypothetical protein
VDALSQLRLARVREYEEESDGSGAETCPCPCPAPAPAPAPARRKLAAFDLTAEESDGSGVAGPFDLAVDVRRRRGGRYVRLGRRRRGGGDSTS